jgi:hypothetical protein
MNTTHTVRIYTASYDGKQYTEHLELRQNARLVTSEPTGAIYLSFQTMEEGVAAKNRVLWNEMAGV